MGEVCVHGSLARSCELCERDKTIDELRAKIALHQESHAEERVRYYRGEWESACERADAMAAEWKEACEKADYWMELHDKQRTRAEAAEAKLAEIEKDRDEWNESANKYDHHLNRIARALHEGGIVVQDDLVGPVGGLLAKLAKFREALEWYAMDWLYDLTHFRTASPVSDVNNPRNMEVEGNPVMHDRGRKAREALAGEKGEGE